MLQMLKAADMDSIKDSKLESHLKEYYRTPNVHLIILLLL